MSTGAVSTETAFPHVAGNPAQKDHGLLRALAMFLGDFMRFIGGRIWFALFILLAGTLLEGLSLVMFVPIIGVVVGHGALQAGGHLGWLLNVLPGDAPLERLMILLGIFAVLMAVRAVAVFRRDMTMMDLQIGFMEDQRARVAESLAAADWHQVARLRHARISHLMSGDVQRVGQAAHFFLLCAVSTTMLIAQCALTFLLAPAFALAAFVVLIVSSLAMLAAMRRTRDLGTFVTNSNLTLLNSTTQFLGGLKLAISQNLQRAFVGEFRQTLREMKLRQIDQMRYQTRARLIVTSAAAFVGATLILLGVGIFHVAPPVLITLILVISRMSGPATQIQQGSQQVAFALPAYQAVKTLEQELAAPPRPYLPVVALADGPVAFEGVSYEHAENDGVPLGVRDLNLRLDPGAFVGVAGPSGAGKTTFADLLVGLYPPQQGRITLGGQALDGAMLNAWRENISYVSQDPFLFHDTVRRNLSWANPQVGEDEMWKMLAFTGADGIVRRMENGLDTVVGERGTLVSGGERQRIALARALLRRPRLLLLDEATNAIDIAGEAELLERLRALDPRPMIVLIAHRSESLAHCERVLRMDAGRLVEV